MRAYYYGNTFVSHFAANSSEFVYYRQLHAFVKGSYRGMNTSTLV